MFYTIYSDDFTVLVHNYVHMYPKIAGETLPGRQETYDYNLISTEKEVRGGFRSIGMSAVNKGRP